MIIYSRNMRTYASSLLGRKAEEDLGNENNVFNYMFQIFEINGEILVLNLYPDT